MKDEVEVLALRKIVPGMIMVCEIDMRAINGDLKERRMYYVVASTNRRVTLLKMTRGGKNSTNWLLPLQMPSGDVSNIVMDCLITVDINKITYRRCVWFTSTDLAIELLNRAIGALIYESTDPNLLKNQKNIDRINAIIDNHEDTNRAYSLYSMQYTLNTEDAEYEGGDADYDYDEEEEEEEELDEEEEEIEEVEDDTETEEEVTEDTEPEPEEEETNEEKALTTNKIQLVVKHGPFKWKKPTFESLFLPGDTNGALTFDDIKYQLEYFGIQENVAKTALGVMVKYGKIAYTNGRYRARLKCMIQKAEYRKYYANIIEDSNIYGNVATAKMWCLSPGYVSQLRKKYGKV